MGREKMSIILKIIEGISNESFIPIIKNICFKKNRLNQIQIYSEWFNTYRPLAFPSNSILR